MSVLVTGSIATDHLMNFPGRFADQLVEDQLDRISLSFLVDELTLRRGGIGANIAFGMGSLGQRPHLVGAVGADFSDYQSWLERHHVDCSGVQFSETRHTARFVCTTDQDFCQIASFYAGAMSESKNIELKPLVEKFNDIDLVVISPSDPEAMERHTEECRQRGYAFAADPSQQLARMEGEPVRKLIDGATFLFSNDYEWGLLQQKTGWDEAEILSKVGMRVTTLGEDGVEIVGADQPRIQVKAMPEARKANATGVGDGFRAGFLTGRAKGLDLENAARLGSMVAVLVLEADGPQEWEFDKAFALQRIADAYGPDAEKAIAPVLD